MKKFNYYCGAAASTWALVVLVIAAELSEPFKALLTAVFTHHWIGKAVIVSLTFVAAGFLIEEKKVHEKAAWYSAIGSLLAILAFFIMKFFI